MKTNRLYCLGLLLLTLGAWAQSVATPDPAATDAPPVPAFSKDHLIPLEMPRYVSLRFGIDPLTLSIGPDGVVRYVVVVVNPSGTLNALYEGIRCQSWEVKTYARYSANGQWSSVSNPEWRALNEQPSRHAREFARQGACQNGSESPASVAIIVNTLKNPNRNWQQ